MGRVRSGRSATVGRNTSSVELHSMPKMLVYPVGSGSKCVKCDSLGSGGIDSRTTGTDVFHLRNRKWALPNSSCNSARNSIASATVSVPVRQFQHTGSRSPSRRHAQGSMQLCIRRNPNMAAHSIFSNIPYTVMHKELYYIVKDRSLQ